MHKRTRILAATALVVVAVASIAVFLPGCLGVDEESTVPKEVENVYKGSEQQANQVAREANLKVIDSAIQIYVAENGHNPTSLNQLVPAYIQSIPTDPLGGKYYIEVSGGQAKAAVR